METRFLIHYARSRLQESTSQMLDLPSFLTMHHAHQKKNKYIFKEKKKEEQNLSSPVHPPPSRPPVSVMMRVMYPAVAESFNARISSGISIT
jgi:hypothetical protein